MEQMNFHYRNIAIQGIGTAVPEHKLDQADTSQRLGQALADRPDSMRWAKRIFKQCGVDTRYTVEPDLLKPTADCRYFPNHSELEVPGTADRMKTYKRESVPLALESARKALRDAKVDASAITHLITVSCTGQFLPGIDTHLIQELGMLRTVTRIPLNFLGCAAGLKGVCLANQIVSSEPGAKVLIVTVELCTLHIQPSSDREALFGASFFGDGSSACVVGTPGEGENLIFQLGQDHSVLLADSADEMIWEVGDHGFDLYLSPNIPKLLTRFVPNEIEVLLNGSRDAELWAIHPGGKGIIDAMETLYSLSEDQTAPSRTILKNYGNMSSATILFVLNEMRHQYEEKAVSGRPAGLAIAFGPGLTCEMIQIQYEPKRNPQHEKELFAAGTETALPEILNTAAEVVRMDEAHV
ncbi:type III polyketide synthase [Paenibacillus pinistramenti]|uniref:type III polyketide synthase n=1 Tax=Paenibacillus pinistramenti TaxID=1768003 RepID=UPI001EF04EFA|nr:type III polyketide synthase [Paenibacillus pinistramenti]